MNVRGLKFLYLLLLHMCLAQERCPYNCRCLTKETSCFLRSMADLQALKNITVHELSFELPRVDASKIKWSNYQFLRTVKKLTIRDDDGKDVLHHLLPTAGSLNYLTIKKARTYSFPEAAYKGRNLVTINVLGPNRKVACVYRKIPSRGNCSALCGDRFYAQKFIKNETICVCALCSQPLVNTPLNDGNTTNRSKTIFIEQGEHQYSLMYSLILAGFSLLALLSNFFILSKICSCHGLSVIKIFGMSLMIFNVLLAEYGIALAAYLSQEDFKWDKRFCSGMSSIKLFAINATVFTLTLMIFHKSINPVDSTLEKRQVRFKAIVYIFEGLMFSGMACVISWIKFNDWDYLCSIYYPRTTVEKLLTGIEITPHITLLLLCIKHVYRGSKRFKNTGHCEDIIELELSPEREHPVFIMALVTLIIWSVPYIVTIAAVGLAGERLSALIRNCAYLTCAAIHPFLFIARNTWICNLCCETQLKTEKDVPLTCECRGMQMCKNCEQDMTRMLAKCEEHYIFEERRKSMSLDNLTLSLPRKKARVPYPNARECQGISHSYPLLSSPIYEEGDSIDRELPSTGSKLSLSAFLGKLLHDKLPDSMISHGTPRRKISVCGKLRDSYASLPLLNSGSAKSTPKKKATSYRVTFRSAHNTPVKRSAANENEQESCALLDVENDDEVGGNVCEEKLSEAKIEDTVALPDPVSNYVQCSQETSVKKEALDETQSKARNGMNCHVNNEKDSEGKARSDNIAGMDTYDILNAVATTPSDPNRHSRIPTFIPFNSEPGPSGYYADKDSDAQTPTSLTSPPPTSAKQEKPKKLKLNGGRKIFKKKNSKQKGDDKPRVSRGPTFFPFTIEEDAALDTNKRRKSKEERGKSKKKKGRKGKQKENDLNVEQNQPESFRTDQRTVSMDSLEWDPSFSLSDSSSSPVDDLVSPVPPAKPSPFALKTIEQSRQSSSSYGSTGKGSSYSMEWDPTGVQPRVLTPQCEWEPYVVEESGSSGSSNGVTGTLSSTRNEIEASNIATA